MDMSVLYCIKLLTSYQNSALCGICSHSLLVRQTFALILPSLSETHIQYFYVYSRTSCN